MAASLESFLSEGEEVRFERSPVGFPPLTGKVVVLYAAILLLAALPAFTGALLFLPLKKIVFPVPIMGLALVLVALLESVRFAAFRSRLYLVTGSRVLVLAGIVRTKLRGQLERARIRGVQLMGSEPAIATGERKLLLTGLDPLDVESLREVLDVPLLPPVTLRARRRRRRSIALLAALIFAGLTESEGLLARRGRLEFQAVSNKVALAISNAEAAVCSAVALETGQLVERNCGQLDVSNTFVTETRFRSRIDIQLYDGVDRIVVVETRCARTANVIPTHPRLEVLSVQGRETPRFLAALKTELEKLGLGSLWPPGAR
jgi:hypothetical protein